MIRSTPPLVSAIATLAAMTQPAVLYAQDSQTHGDSVLVPSTTGSGNSGRVSINIAAGEGNQQAATASIGIGDIATLALSVSQQNDRNDAPDRITSIVVGPGALSDNQGLVSVNLTAGSHNQSANLASLDIGISGAVSDQLLAQASAPTKPSEATELGPEQRNDRVAVHDTALSDNSGLVQVNLIGGERNSSANIFSLNVSAGGNP